MQGAVQRAAGMRAVAARGLATTAGSLEKGFLGSFFERKVEAQAAAHSDKFAKKERVSEICTHNVRWEIPYCLKEFTGRTRLTST